jgi:hypothetical protein
MDDRLGRRRLLLAEGGEEGVQGVDRDPGRPADVDDLEAVGGDEFVEGGTAEAEGLGGFGGREQETRVPAGRARPVSGIRLGLGSGSDQGVEAE